MRLSTSGSTCQEQPLDNGCMQSIQKIDGELTRLFCGFEQTAQELEFEPLGDLLQVDLDSIQFSGLYFFEVLSSPYGAATLDGWLSCFTEKWDQEEFKKSFVPSCPRFRRGVWRNTRPFTSGCPCTWVNPKGSESVFGNTSIWQRVSAHSP